MNNKQLAEMIKSLRAKKLFEVAKKIVPGADEEGTEGHRNSTGGGGFSPAAIPNGIGGPNRDKGVEAGGSGRRFSIGGSSNAAGSGRMGTIADRLRAARTNARPFNKRQLPVVRNQPGVPATTGNKTSTVGASGLPAARPAPMGGSAPGRALVTRPNTSVAPTGSTPGRSVAPSGPGTSVARPGFNPPVRRTLNAKGVAAVGAGAALVGASAVDGYKKAAQLRAQAAQERLSAARRGQTTQQGGGSTSSGATTTAGSPAPGKPQSSGIKPAARTANYKPGDYSKFRQGNTQAPSRPAASGLTTGDGSVVSKPAATTTATPPPKPQPKPTTQAAKPVAKPAAAPVKKAAPVVAKPKPQGTPASRLQSRSERDAVAGPRKDSKGLNMHSATRPNLGKKS